MAVFNYFFGFTGRITRLHWWLGSLALSFLAIVGVIAVIFGAVATAPPNLDQASPEVVLSWVLSHAWKFLVVLLPTFIGQISLTLRRYHDRDKSGWWVLLGFVPTALWFISLSAPMWAFVSLPASLIIPIWQLIELGCLAGTPGSNDYGPDPREGSLDDLAAEIVAMDPRYQSGGSSRGWSPAPAQAPVQQLAVAARAHRAGPPVFGKRA